MDDFAGKRKGQLFSYLIVIDFESTCWKDAKFQTNEIIEFPALLLNNSTGKIESEFHYYVQPEEQPTLSDFCKELTGITQEQVDNGIPLRLCIKKFSHWLDKLQREKRIVFNTSTSESNNNCTFVTWSDWDLGVCLFNECRRKQLLKPSQLNSWIDLRATYRKFYDRRPNGLNGALQDLGIEFEGREHSGLHDSRNTASLAYRMMCDGCILTVTKTLKGKNEEIKIPIPAPVMSTHNSPTKSPLHKRRKGYSCGKQSFTPPNSKQRTTSTRSPNCETPERKRKSRIPVYSPGGGASSTCTSQQQLQNRAASSKQSVRSPNAVKRDTSKIKQNSKIPASTNNSPKSKINISEKFTTDQIYADPLGETDIHSFRSKLPNTGLSTQDTNSVTPANKVDVKTIPTVKKDVFTNMSHSNSLTKCFNNMSCDKNESLKGKTPLSNIMNLATKGNVKQSQTFKTPSPVLHFGSASSSSSCTSKIVTPPGSGSLTLKFTGYTTPNNGPSSNSFKTPSAFNSTVSSAMKSTPPLCKCGRRAKRKMAQTPGPNCGRFFFSCGVGNQHNQGSARNGCGYFQWEFSASLNKSSLNSSCRNSTVCKPFTPVYQNSFTYGSSCNQRRNLGVRPTTQRAGIR